MKEIEIAKSVEAQVKDIFNVLSKRASRSIHIYIAINFTLLLSSAFLVVLNLYMVRMNPGTIEVKWIFISLAICSSLSAGVSSYMTLLVFRKRSKTMRIKAEKLSAEWKLYQNKEGGYEKLDRDQVLVNRAEEILSRD